MQVEDSLQLSFPTSSMPWVQTVPGVPYFQTEDGEPWHPIGQNDSITWFELQNLYKRRDMRQVDGHLAWLAGHGVTCLRLMLEYAQVRSRYFETVPGKWSPHMVQLWDDMFELCDKHGLRILLTPYDTFWMWLKFHHHPYNAKHGGPLHHPSRALLDEGTRDAIKARLSFVADRWGGTGTLFAWDLWNEIHPAHAEDQSAPFHEFIEDLSNHVRSVEMEKFGRAHPQTVSLYGPELRLKAHLQMEPHIYRHPSLDFATIHIYQHGTIDDPKNTVDPAVSMGKVVRQSLHEIEDTRPFLDTEHGPIHAFKDKRRTLPEHFDDEYFRHMQWAHLASGGAGGGMRWPNRHPHALTHGMRRAQRALADFMPHIDWLRFHRRNVTDDLRLYAEGEARPVAGKYVARFGCASDDQAVIYLLRRDALLKNGKLDRRAAPMHLSLKLPALVTGDYAVVAWDTVAGHCISSTTQALHHRAVLTLPPLHGDMALAIKRVG